MILGSREHRAWSCGTPLAGSVPAQRQPAEHRPCSSPRFSRETGNLELREKLVKHWEGQTKLICGWTWRTAHRLANSTLHDENTEAQERRHCWGKARTQPASKPKCARSFPSHTWLWRQPAPKRLWLRRIPETVRTAPGTAIFLPTPQQLRTGLGILLPSSWGHLPGPRAEAP